MLTKEDLEMISNIVKTEIKTEVAPINHRLDRMENRLCSIDQRVCKIEQRVTIIEERVSNIEESLEETRTATNRLLDWADRVNDVIGVRV